MILEKGLKVMDFNTEDRGQNTEHRTQNTEGLIFTDLERRLLEIIQQEFPLESRPFKVIGERLGVDENLVIESVLSLKNKGVIREIGPIFNHKKLGYKTTLIGIAVEAERIDKVARIINEYEEVTHNYERDGEFNLWFTLVGKEKGLPLLINEIVKAVSCEKFVELPTIASFKLEFELKI